MKVPEGNTCHFAARLAPYTLTARKSVIIPQGSLSTPQSLVPVFVTISSVWRGRARAGLVLPDAAKIATGKMYRPAWSFLPRPISLAAREYEAKNGGRRFSNQGGLAAFVKRRISGF